MPIPDVDCLVPTVVCWEVERAGMRRSGYGGDDGVAVSVGLRGNVGEQPRLLSLSSGPADDVGRVKGRPTPF